MADDKNAVKAPPKMKFDKGFLSDTGNLDAAKLTGDLRSFMDRGNDAFAGDSDRTTAMKQGVRNTLLTKMRDENLASHVDAEKAERDHIEYTETQMLPLIKKVKEAKRDELKAEARLMKAETRMGIDRSQAINTMVTDANTLYQNAQQDLADQGGQPPAAPAPVRGQVEVGPETQESVNEKKADYDEILAIQNKMASIRGRRGIKKILNAFAETRKNSAEGDLRSARDTATREKNNLAQALTDCSARWTARRNTYRESTFRMHYNAYDAYAVTYYQFSRDLEGQQARNIDQIGGANAKKRIEEYTGVYDDTEFAGIAAIIDANPYANIKLKRVKNKDLTANSFNEEDPNKPIKYHKTMVMHAFADGIHGLTDEARPGQGRKRMKMLSNFHGYEARNQYRAHNSLVTAPTRRTDDNRGRSQNGVMLTEDTLRDASALNLVADEKGTNNEYLVSEKSSKIYTVRTKDGRTVKGFYKSGQFISEDAALMSDKSLAKGNTDWTKMGNMETIRMAIRRSDFFRHVNAGTIQYYMTYNPEDEFDSQGNLAAIRALNPAQTGNASAAHAAYMSVESYKNGVFDITRVTRDVLAVAQNDTFDNVRHIGVLLLSEDDPRLWNVARDLASRMTGKFGFGRLAHRLKGIPQSGEVMRIALLEEFAKDRSFKLNSLDTYTNLAAAARPDLLNMHIEDLSARRDSFFSLTNLRQSFWDGSMLGALTGTLSAASGDAYNIAQATGASDRTLAQAKFAKSYGAFAASTSALPGAAIIDAAALFTLFEDNGSAIGQTSMGIVAGLRSCIRFVQDILKIVQTAKKAYGSDNTSVQKEAVARIFQLVVQVLIDLADCVINFIGAFMDKMPAAVGGIFGLVKNLVAGIRDVITLISAGIDRHRITSAQEGMDSAMSELQTFRSVNPRVAVTENTAGISEKQKMGLAAEGNSQGQAFLALAKQRAKKRQLAAGFDIGANVLDAAGNATGTWTPLAFPFKIAGKLVSFIGWVAGKAYDEHAFNDNMARMLGYRYFGNWDGFDEALNRETGIKNMHYLLDLSRIFMAIDTHALVHNPNKSDGETAFAINLMGPYLSLAGSGETRYSNAQNKASNVAMLQTVRLGQLLKAVSAPGNWRAVLRSSITK